VAEEETANHSGHSAWADEKWRYVNLNESFIGVSFEAITPPGPDPDLGSAHQDGESKISPAQVRSAAILVEMLRHRYHIPESNCVTTPRFR